MIKRNEYRTFAFDLYLPDNWNKDGEETSDIKKTMSDLEKEPEIEASCSAELMDQISFI